jgi:DNA-binding beta-propeller fold protein YncE
MMQRSFVPHLVLALAVLVEISAPASADIIVAGYFDSSILRYGEDGTPMNPIVPPGGTSGVVGPSGITFGPDGSLYVSNQTSMFSPGAPDSIVKVDPSTGEVMPFIMLASGYLPAGLRFGPDGNLYVSRNGGLSAATGTGSVDEYNGTTGAFIGSVVTNLTQPTGLLFDSTGKLYVSSYQDGSVVVYDGTNATVLVAKGQGNLMAPAGLAFGPDGNLYVVDLLLGAVRRYDLKGNFIGGLIPVGGQLFNQFPSDLLFDRHGHLLVADLGASYTAPEGGIKEFDPVTGDHLGDFASGIWGSQMALTP